MNANCTNHTSDRNSTRTRRPGRRLGITTVETAVVAPLVILLLIGLIDLGICVYSHTVLAEATRAGCRFAAVHGSKSSDPIGPTSNNARVETLVRSQAAGIISSNLTISSSWPNGDNAPGSRVNVKTQYNYRFISLLGLGTVRLNSSASMTILN